MGDIEDKKALTIIGQNIKNARISKKLTQEQIAEKLNKSVNFVSLLERGKTGPSIKTIIDLCNCLKIDPNYLFSDVIANSSKENYIEKYHKILNDKDKKFINTVIKYITEK